MASVVKLVALLLILKQSDIDASPVKTKVLILGAGPAGIGFASKLHGKGEKDFLILEAQNYIGGRVKDVKFVNSTIQAGANWIHDISNENSFSILKQTYGLKVTKDDYNDFIVRDLQGKVVNGAQTEYQNLMKKIKEMYTLVGKMKKNQEYDIPLKTAFQFVGWNPKSPLQKALDYYVADFENEKPPTELSAFSNEFTGEGTDEFVTDQRGYAYVLRQQAQTFLRKVHLNTVVKKISYDDKKVTVETSSGTKYEADYAYVTFSTGVLASSNVVFNPPLPAWKMKAVYMLPMGQYTKIFLRFPTKFWDNNRYILIANSNRGHYVHFMNLDRQGLFPGKRMLVATVTNKESERVEKLNDTQVKNEVYDVLKKAYPNATVPSDIFVSRWSLDNTTYGAYSSPVIGSDKYSFINLKAPVNKTLWFGGEAATDEDSYGFAHEAYSGGVAQADQLLACIKDGSKCPVYKQRQQPKTCSSSVKSESFLPFIVTGLLFCFLFVENY